MVTDGVPSHSSIWGVGGGLAAWLPGSLEFHQLPCLPRLGQGGMDSTGRFSCSTESAATKECLRLIATSYLVQESWLAGKRPPAGMPVSTCAHSCTYQTTPAISSAFQKPAWTLLPQLLPPPFVPLVAIVPQLWACTCSLRSREGVAVSFLSFFPLSPFCAHLQSVGAQGLNTFKYIKGQVENRKRHWSDRQWPHSHGQWSWNCQATC